MKATNIETSFEIEMNLPEVKDLLHATALRMRKRQAENLARDIETYDHGPFTMTFPDIVDNMLETKRRWKLMYMEVHLTKEEYEEWFNRQPITV